MKLSYNAPVIITFTLLASAIFGISLFTGGTIIEAFFRTPGNQEGFKFLSPQIYKLISHTLGHKDLAHLLGNFSFILLIGPILEEKYGSLRLLAMMFITALITGIINVIFFNSGLIGASGIVFMLILLISFTNIKAGEIPLTSILIALLFLTKEILQAFQPDQISQTAHLIGGICGGAFGFLLTPSGKNKKITDDTKI